ncbi:MAG: hypothetical protein AAGA48_14160 [Myxococcota bacterium]
MLRHLFVLLIAVPTSFAQEVPDDIFGRTSTGLAAATHPSQAKNALESQRLGADWLVSVQGRDGGWGAGTMGTRNAGSAASDVATTAYTVMALTRDALDTDRHLQARLRGIEFVVKSIETAPEGPGLNTPQGTQPQHKLGPLVDTHLAAQMLGQVVGTLPNKALKARASKAYDIVLSKVQQSQQADGRFDQGGWASQLSSGIATEALEVAKSQDRKVDDQVLEKAQARNEAVANMDGEGFDATASAGVQLYSVATSTRAAKKAKDRHNREGNQEKASQAQAISGKGTTAANDQGVINGFGSVGGEENLSYNMIADTLAEEGGQAWVEWSENINKTLMGSQNANGSWVGHHCITSPVFVSAGAVMTLSAGPWAEHQKRLAKK